MTLGLDISTSVIGVSLFDDNDKVCSLEYIKFKQKSTLFEKLNDFIEYMRSRDYKVEEKSNNNVYIYGLDLKNEDQD